MGSNCSVSKWKTILSYTNLKINFVIFSAIPKGSSMNIQKTSNTNRKYNLNLYT